MKYTEFIKNMNSLGFSVEIGNAGTLICKRVNSDTAVISISKIFENSIKIFTKNPYLLRIIYLLCITIFT